MPATTFRLIKSQNRIAQYDSSEKDYPVFIYYREADLVRNITLEQARQLAHELTEVLNEIDNT